LDNLTVTREDFGQGSALLVDAPARGVDDVVRALAAEEISRIAGVPNASRNSSESSTVVERGSVGMVMTG
jgi:hypothetical protein